MDRFEVTGTFETDEHPLYPYAKTEPFSEIWVTVCENKDGNESWHEPMSFGTLGEWLDIQVENSDLDPAYAQEALQDIQADGFHIALGGVGCAFRIEKTEAPELQETLSAPAL